MRGIIFKTAKEAFRRGFKKYKRGQRKTERVPYDLVKADIKRKIRGTRFYVGAEAKARPGIGSKGLPRGGKPRIFGKAYASDKRGKTMQIPMMTKKQRAANQEAISQSVRKFMKEKIGRKSKGGMQKMLLGGLLTAPIKASAKKLFKSGTRKTQQIVKESGGSRSQAKDDVRSAIRDDLKSSLSTSNLVKSKRRMIIRDINKLR
jgi:hypothetical protein|tara:strand:+ start:4993 stop:5604 length:612 start_codon:yes stop_codon:yes gene_type:complete